MTIDKMHHGHLTASMLWQFAATPREMLLILKGLGDRLDDDELAEAQELCDRLTRERITQTRNILQSIDKLEKNLDAKDTSPA